MNPEGIESAPVAFGVLPMQKASASVSESAISRSVESVGGKKVQKLLESTTWMTIAACACWLTRNNEPTIRDPSIDWSMFDYMDCLKSERKMTKRTREKRYIRGEKESDVVLLQKDPQLEWQDIPGHFIQNRVHWDQKHTNSPIDGGTIANAKWYEWFVQQHTYSHTQDIVLGWCNWVVMAHKSSHPSCAYSSYDGPGQYISIFSNGTYTIDIGLSYLKVNKWQLNNDTPLPIVWTLKITSQGSKWSRTGRMTCRADVCLYHTTPCWY